MGIFSSKYKFHVDGKDWCVHMRTHWDSWKYTVRIEGEVVSDVHQKTESSVELIRGTKLNVSDNGRDYVLKIAPVSAWDYGVHVYRDGALIHRYKNKDFVTLKKHEKFFGKFDKLGNKIGFDRPLWKIIIEALIIGGVFGAMSGLVLNFMEDKNVIAPGGDYTNWVILFAVVIVLFLPAKLRLFK